MSIGVSGSIGVALGDVDTADDLALMEKRNCEAGSLLVLLNSIDAGAATGVVGWGEDIVAMGASVRGVHAEGRALVRGVEVVGRQRRLAAPAPSAKGVSSWDVGMAYNTHPGRIYDTRHPFLHHLPLLYTFTLMMKLEGGQSMVSKLWPGATYCHTPALIKQ